MQLKTQQTNSRCVTLTPKQQCLLPLASSCQHVMLAASLWLQNPLRSMHQALPGVQTAVPRVTAATPLITALHVNRVDMLNCLLLQPGLLSQAFRGGGGGRPFGRAVSLSNLLDAPADGGGIFGSLSSSLGNSQQKRPQGSGDSTPTAASGAGSAFDEGDAGKKWRKKLPPQWNNKNNVIEMLNELIDELDGIEQQIAQQAVEHIHANEVSHTNAAGLIDVDA